MALKLQLPPDSDHPIFGSDLDSYIESGGARCPHCKSENLKGAPYRTEIPGLLIQKVSCEECGKCWDDWYALYFAERAYETMGEIRGKKQGDPE